MKQNLFCRKNKKKSAFSLIELSIVLIIIGLLIAGVTGGASLIKSSELRAIMSEARSFATAVNGFYNQFNYLPGDYATAIGGSSAGNGDGSIQYYSSTATVPTNEGRAAWYQMKGAGTLDSSIISATIATTIAATVPAIPTFGTNVPSSKIKNSGWDFDYNTTSLQNVVVLTGAIGAGSATDTLVNGAFKSTAAIAPTDALSIDAKIDDGVANAGKVRGVLVGCFGTTAYTTGTTTKACALSYQVDINS